MGSSGYEEFILSEYEYENKLLRNRVARLEDALNEARLQFEYLHGKFQETGSGNSVLARIDSALEEE